MYEKFSSHVRLHARLWSRRQVPRIRPSFLSPLVPTQRDSSELDELLDEIDEVLEENAEEFVKNYVQKGGE